MGKKQHLEKLRNKLWRWKQMEPKLVTESTSIKQDEQKEQRGFGNLLIK